MRRQHQQTKKSLSSPRCTTGSVLWLWGLHLAMSWQLASAIQYFNCPTPVEPVVQRGKRFFDSNGNYFPIKGIAYYPRPNSGELSFSNSVDFFTDQYQGVWEPAIAQFQSLGVNVIRIYAVDPSQSHDGFMCALQKAGIYVIVGLLADCENCAVGIESAPDCYPPSLKNRGQWIINVFSKYTNTLAFSAGNEATIFAESVYMNAPCQKKFMRDMRAFMHKCRQVPASILPRDIPIGMVNWDFDRQAQTLYFNCRTNTSDIHEEAEWYGLNAYQHCDPHAVTVEDLGGWQTLRDDFASYNLRVPVVIAEYGCRNRFFPRVGEFAAQRTWLQADALYNPQYSDVFAGAIAFEYSAEKRQADGSAQQTPWPYRTFTEYQFGVGYFSPIDCDHVNVLCEYVRYPEFDLLAQKLAQVDTTFAPSIDEYDLTGELPQCPETYAPVTDFVWPSDTTPDEWCYVVGTEPPTSSPMGMADPVTVPTVSSNIVELTGQPTLSPTSSPVAQKTTKQPSVQPTFVITNQPQQTKSPPPSMLSLGNSVAATTAPAASSLQDKDPTSGSTPFHVWIAFLSALVLQSALHLLIA